jgi:hypothetical protein
LTQIWTFACAQELCCELASLQCEQMVPLLTLHQLVHTVWRLQLCADLEGMIKKFAEVSRMCCMSMSSSSCGFL